MIKGRTADLVVSLYLLVTLYMRFSVENGLLNHPVLSLALGIVMLLFLWALIKVKFLVPDYFGLLTKKDDSHPVT